MTDHSEKELKEFVEWYFSNFNRSEARNVEVKIPHDALALMGKRKANEFDMNDFASEMIPVHLEPSETKVVDLDSREVVHQNGWN